jgi:trigger factor
MQVTVEVLPGLERKMLVKVPSEGVQKEIEKRLKDMAPQVKLDGFRPGKVPFNIVRQRFEDSIRREVVSEVIGATYQQALQQEKLVPAGVPKVHLATVVPGQALEYEAIFEIYPTIQLNELNGVEIESIKIDVTENDIDNMLEKLRRQQAEWVETDKPAEKGDRVVIDFNSLMDGASFEGGSGNNVTVELGAGGAIPDFENALVGKTAGQENIQFDIRFPENYYRKDLAGKSSHVTANVHKILVAKLPPLDEAFAKKLGVAEGDIEKLRREVRDNLLQQLENNNKAQIKSQILAKLLELNPVELPQIMLEEEIKNLKHQNEQAGTDPRHLNQPKQAEDNEAYAKLAQQRVGLGLLFGEIIRTYQIKVDQSKVQAMLERMTASYQDPQSVIAWYRNNKEQMTHIEGAVIEDQIVEILSKQVTFKETVKSYRDLAGVSQ